jgi:hypothetical protein
MGMKQLLVALLVGAFTTVRADVVDDLMATMSIEQKVG